MKTVRLLQAVYKLFPCEFVNIYTKWIREKWVNKLLMVGYILGYFWVLLKWRGNRLLKIVVLKGRYKIYTSEWDAYFLHMRQLYNF